MYEYIIIIMWKYYILPQFNDQYYDFDYGVHVWLELFGFLINEFLAHVSVPILKNSIA